MNSITEAAASAAASSAFPAGRAFWLRGFFALLLNRMAAVCCIPMMRAAGCMMPQQERAACSAGVTPDNRTVMIYGDEEITCLPLDGEENIK